MKRVSLFALIFFGLMVNSSYAHPPSKIEMNYDSATKTLSSVITHKTFFKKKHRISRVEVIINEELVKTEEFNEQFNKKEQHFSSVIEDIKEGDVIEIIAYCNIFGKRAASLIIEP